MEINEELNQVIMSAFNEASTRNHEYLTPEHLLYASLFYEKGRTIIENCGADIERLRTKIENHLSKNIPVLQGKEPNQSMEVFELFSSVDDGLDEAAYVCCAN